MLAMQLIMNADRDKYGSLIEDYNREFLGGTTNTPRLPKMHTTCSRDGTSTGLSKRLPVVLDYPSIPTEKRMVQHLSTVGTTKRNAADAVVTIM